MKELEEFLEKLNLDNEQISVYLYLLQNGGSTILQLSKGTKINRTALYRLCEKMAASGFLKKHADAHTTIYEAASVTFLKTKVESIVSNAAAIQDEYKEIEQVYQKLINVKNHRIKVIHYTGSEEVKQLIWNSLDAKNVNVGFGYRTMSEAVGKDFIVKWWNECTRRRRRQKVLANPGTFEMKNTVDATTQEKYDKNLPNIMQEKVIDTKIFKINQETFIYNDVYAIIQWDKNEIFGVEIYNQAVADQQREIFDLLWKLGKPVIS